MTTATPQSSPPEKALTLGAPLGSRGVQLSSIDDLLRMATVIVGSGLAPQGDTPQKVAVKIQLGLELGLPPMASLTKIAVINGRPGIFGDAGKALVLGSGLQEAAPRVVWSGEPGQDDWTCDVWLKRKGVAGEFHGSFSVAQAKRAKLWTKTGPWTDHPGRQIEWRAWWWAAREGFADVLGGISAGEELVDVETEPPKDVPVEVKPKGLDELARAEFAEVIDKKTGENTHTPHPRAFPGRPDLKMPPYDPNQHITDDDSPDRAQQRLEIAERLHAEAAKQDEAKKETKKEKPPTIHTWHPDGESVVETCLPVSCGSWGAWCDEELPKGKLHAIATNAGAATWRTLAKGKKGGARHSAALEVLTGFQKANPKAKAKDVPVSFQRLACTLAILLEGREHKVEPTPASAVADLPFG